MGKRIYVGNLSFDTTDAALEQLFAQYGAVESAQVLMDRDTGRSKGFGFVAMKSATRRRRRPSPASAARSSAAGR